jgi:hypothetical protein
MEQFYKLLREYNKNFAKPHFDLPEWFFQYTESNPPLYWKTIYQVLNDKNKNYSVVEIGAGFGDITALLNFMGYKNIVSYERDSRLCNNIKDKIISLFGYRPKVINAAYPEKLNYTPDILLQVNCIYIDGIKNKEEFVKQIRTCYETNGVPKLYILEVIDDSYKADNDIFPKYIRLNRLDIRQLFPMCEITEYKTYIYPKNKVSKTLYCICR